MKKLVVALTGGIGCGKSVVSQLFKNLGVDVIDTDLIARSLVTPGSLALNKISDYFGASILNKEGELKRSLLRKKIFKDPQAKKWLEELLHPLIRAESLRQIQLASSPYCIVVIPLLFETKPSGLYNRILVVDASYEDQVKRVMERDQCSEEECEQILKSQVSRQTRLEGADDVISNDKSLSLLRSKVEKLHEYYLTLNPR